MAGADVNAKDLETDENRYPNGWAPLHLAILSQKVKATKLLLDKGADVNATDQYAKSTPLHFAAHLGNTELVKILLTAHANRDAKDAEKRTPLELAMKQGHTEVVKLLGGSN